MKLLLKNTVIALFLLLFSFAKAQNQPSLLWEISGNNLTKPSYLFGTIHIICPEDYIMTETIKNTIKNADAFYAEIDFTNIKDILSMQNASKSNTPLSERISKNQYIELQELLKKTINTDINDYENLSDIAITSNITIKSFPCKNFKIYETELLQYAILSQKRLGGLETAKEQIDIMSKSANIDSIIEMLKAMEKNIYESSNKMTKLYKQQDIDAIYLFTKKSLNTDSNLYEEILYKRNHNWINIIPNIIQKQSTFFAVGVAHLGGKNGIIELLRQKGYQLKPIKI